MPHVRLPAASLAIRILSHYASMGLCGLSAILLAILVLIASPARGQDVEGSADHPLVGRYEGSTIVHYKARNFDETAILNAAIDYAALLDANRTHDRSGPQWLRLEGRVTEIRYAVPPERSSLEVMRNYETALEQGGFTPGFRCKDQDCFVGRLTDPYLMGELVDPDNGLSTAYFDHARYLVVERSGPQGVVHVAVLTGEYRNEVTAFVRIVETAAVETGKVAVEDASALGEAIRETGTVSVYGILFDSAQATLKPDSRPTLEEIGKLMAAEPQLRLEIVGHTDNVGGEAYNLDLSRQRAASVVAALTGEHGVSPERLSSSGSGYSQPVSSNDSEEGRALNRRVELRAR